MPARTYHRVSNFTGTGTGAPVSVPENGVASLAIQVKGVGAAPTSWTIVLEGSLDGVNYTTILTHNNTDLSDGEVFWTGAVLYPCRYFRARVTALTLGGATSVDAYICGA